MLNAIKQKIDKMGEIYSPGNVSRRGHLYNPLPFPEFKSIPSQREAVYDRFNLIKPHVEGKDLLDIGCHTGFNCFMFEKEGFHCTGIELHKLTCEIAQDVGEYKKSDCVFINSEATPDLIEGLGQFDTTLFLSTFQWVTLAKGFKYATEVLKAALKNSKVLFFETSMGVEGKAKMPMLPTPEAVEAYLTGLCDEVENLGEVIAPGGKEHPRRVIFKCR